MKENFNKCLEFVLKWEGGFVNDPNDPGGRTIYGISEKAHPEIWAKGIPTKEDAKILYKKEYWEKIKGDELPPELDLVVFDAAVNLGVNRAIRMLQRMFEVKEDGILGPVTLNAILSKHALMFNELRRQYYQKIITRFPNLKRFEKGWNNRVEDLDKTVRKE